MDHEIGLDRRIHQQQLRWNLAYGPLRAASLTEQLRTRLVQAPERELGDHVADLDPQPVPPGDELAAPRW